MCCKKTLYSFILLFVFLSLAACSSIYSLETSIGRFDMAFELSDTFESSVPALGSEFLIVTLMPENKDITEKQIRDYFLPGDDCKGAVAKCGEGEYTFSSIRFKKENNALVCTIVFEIPKELTNTDKVTLMIS